MDKHMMLNGHMMSDRDMKDHDKRRKRRQMEKRKKMLAKKLSSEMSYKMGM